jgi:GDPmannose 4,6-dehydratase
MCKKALITGITGQSGSYMAELLLDKGYAVHGIVRRISHPNFENIQSFIGYITLHHGDMTDSVSLHNIIAKVHPDEIYNFAGMSQVRVSYDTPVSTFDVNTLGLLRIIESVRSLDLDCKIYQACSSEMFGKVQEFPQKETTPFYPRSPYGVSKAAAYYMAKTYREAYGMKIYTGILFNHESPRRGCEFLSRKVCDGVAEIVKGKREKITLGNLDAKRDWGYAKEYMEWVYKIMQHVRPDDFIIATGESHSVKEFIKEAFACVGIEDWEKYVEFDKNLLRAAEVDVLQGDYTKSEVILGYEPKVKFKELVKIMMEAALHD